MLKINLKKKVKKKEKPKKFTGKGLKIVDEDSFASAAAKPASEESDVDDAEELPQIAAVVDERPVEVQVLESFNKGKWKRLEDDAVKETQLPSSPPHGRGGGSPDVSPPRQRKRHSSDDTSPPRRKRRPGSNDVSPPRRKRRDSDDVSPPRHRRRSSRDTSPPRQSRRRNSDDESPPKQRRRGLKDASPPRQRRRRNSDDESPPRQRRRGSKDASSPRQRRRRDSGDASPPRQRRRGSKDTSLPRQIKRRDSGDVSPPRKRQPSDDVDFSPRRRRRRSGSNDANPLRRNDMASRNFDNRRRDRSRNVARPEIIQTDLAEDDKSKTTLDGKKAGLQKAAALRDEMHEFRKRENEMYELLPDEVSGRNAKAVVRDRRTEEDLAREAEKAKKESERKKQYDKWGKGLKQVEEQQERVQSAIHEMAKPLARAKDDVDLDVHLKNINREGDPMLEYLAAKRRKAVGVPEKPKYNGPPPPPNRFHIPPGYRWDGVDRSNGYEKEWFGRISAKKALQDEAYKWSVEDL